MTITLDVFIARQIANRLAVQALFAAQPDADADRLAWDAWEAQVTGLGDTVEQCRNCDATLPGSQVTYGDEGGEFCDDECVRDDQMHLAEMAYESC